MTTRLVHELDEETGRGDLPARTSLTWTCEHCEEPAAIVHVTREGERVCGLCAASIEAVREALATYRHAERLRVIRARAVLAREKIAGYGKTGGER